MSMNPFKYLGGLVLEIGAVIAALAFLPALGGSPVDLLPQPRSSSLAPAAPNQVFFDAQSNRMLDTATRYPQPGRGAWQNDFAPPPPVAQQRFVEGMLDHNSQRALDTATRIWTRGDELLPPELRMRREENPPLATRELNPPSRELSPPSHYAPQRRVVDERY
jgi:hypothetical protein